LARLSREKARLARQVGTLTAIPFILVAGPAVGYLIGSWIDGRLGSEPIFLIVFLVLGFVAAGRETYRLIQLASREDDSEDERKGGSPPV
jgi:F0F1-type ATP synthase assembly protein I